MPDVIAKIAAFVALEGWLSLGSSWAGEKLKGAKQYLAAVLPAAAALAVGLKIGMARG